MRTERVELRFKETRLQQEYDAYSQDPAPEAKEMARAVAKSLALVQAEIQRIQPPAYLQELREQQGTDYVADCIALLLADLADYFNVSGNFSGKQIEATAAMVLVEFPGWTLEHVAKGLEAAKRGQYGETYRLDGQVVLGWLRKYRQELRKKIQEANYQAHANQKESPHEPRSYREHGPEDPSWTAFKAAREIENLKQQQSEQNTPE